jgi:hypothetical protein
VHGRLQATQATTRLHARDKTNLPLRNMERGVGAPFTSASRGQLSQQAASKAAELQDSSQRSNTGTSSAPPHAAAQPHRGSADVAQEPVQLQAPEHRPGPQPEASSSPFPEPDLAGVLTDISERHASLQPAAAPHAAPGGGASAFPAATHRKQSRFALARARVARASADARTSASSGIAGCSTASMRALPGKAETAHAAPEDARRGAQSAGASGGDEAQLEAIRKENDDFLARLTVTEVCLALNSAADVFNIVNCLLIR